MAQGNGPRLSGEHVLERGLGGVHFFGCTATRAAEFVMPKSSALEVAVRGIRVNALCPGLVDTPSAISFASAVRPQGMSSDVREDTPTTAEASDNRGCSEGRSDPPG